MWNKVVSAESDDTESVPPFFIATVPSRYDICSQMQPYSSIMLDWVDSNVSISLVKVRLHGSESQQIAHARDDNAPALH